LLVPRYFQKELSIAKIVRWFIIDKIYVSRIKQIPWEVDVFFRCALNLFTFSYCEAYIDTEKCVFLEF